MRNSRDRARREYAPASQPNHIDSRAAQRNDDRFVGRADTRVDSRTDSRSDARSAPKRSHFSGAGPLEHVRKRTRPHFSFSGPQAGPGSAPPGAIGSKSIKIGEDVIAATPRLSELLAEQKRQATWPWDKPADGYENVSAQTLKLLGYAAPDTVYTRATVPEEIARIQQTKALTARASWLVCQIGANVYESAREATIAFAKHEGARPPKLRSILEREMNEQHYQRAPSTSESQNHSEGPRKYAPLCAANLYTDPHAVIARDCRSQDDAQKRYGTDALLVEPLDAENLLVKFDTAPTTLQDGDSWLFPEEVGDDPVVEVLNAFSLARPDAADVLRAVSQLCAKAGFEPASVWKSAENLPFQVPRVYIALADAQRAQDAAAALGEMRLQGRPLVTALNYSIKVQ